MTQTYHYDVKSQPFPICEAPIYTYDASSPHVHLGVHCRAANSKGKERDSESGNDYAMMRSSVNRLGRFSSPDLLAGSTSDPQSLNHYTYGLNDPVNLIDPFGLDTTQTCLEDIDGNVVACSVTDSVEVN